MGKKRLLLSAYTIPAAVRLQKLSESICEEMNLIFTPPEHKQSHK